MDVLSVLAVIGFSIMGMLIPELFVSMGGGKIKVPTGQNLMGAASAFLISSYFIFN